MQQAKIQQAKEEMLNQQKGEPEPATPILQQEMLSLPELDEKIRMYFKRQDNRPDGVMSATEDLDEFDRILL